MIKNKFLFFCVLIFAVCVCTCAQNSKETFDIRVGINLSEWLEKNENLDQKDSIVTLTVLDSLKAWGFDHVRIPINEEVLFDESLNIRPKFFELLKSRVDHCKKIGLKVIIDLHGSRLFYFAGSNNTLFNEPQPIDVFLNVWGKIQAIFRDYPTDFLAYECLNEPAAAIGKHHLWNNVLSQWVAFIRKTESQRFLFIGTNRGNQLWTLKYLKIPQDDRLVLTLHYYSPFLFTHYHPQEAKTSNFYGKVHYPGKTINDEDYNSLPDNLKKDYASYREYYDKNRIYKDIEEAIDFSKKNNIPLNFGEFGCRRFSNPEDRLQWFRDMTSIFKDNGISYTLWGFGGAGFGIWINGKLDKPMINAVK